MAILLDKLKNMGIQKFKGTQPTMAGQQPSPLPTMTDTLTKAPKPLTTTPVSQRMAQLPEKGMLGSMPQWKGINKRFIADLPAKTQLEGIQNILSGGDSGSPIVNNFVTGMAQQGKNPEEIRQAFINQQKTSSNPLVLM